MNYAYFGIPHMGGTYTVYHALRAGLAEHGIAVRWLGIGPRSQSAYDDPQWAHERDHGKVVAGDTDDERKQAHALLDYLHASELDGVFVNVLANRVQTNVMRYLDPSIRRIMIVHSITPATYGAARTIRDHVHATVGVSPRIRQDLIKRFGFADERTYSIPNAVDLRVFGLPRVARVPGEPLRILFLGRIVDTDKGVFWLPRIMERVPAGIAHLTVVGDGPDLEELKQRCSALEGRIRFAGRISANEVPAMLARHDVFIFPSRFEGLGLSLVEAMAAGCVPVATRIKNVTSFVVEDGENGALFDMGNSKAAATAIIRLAGEPETLRCMSESARKNVANRFGLDRMAKAYLDVLKSVHSNHRVSIKPLERDNWSYPRSLRSGWRTSLPRGVKNLLRVWREKLA